MYININKLYKIFLRCNSSIFINSKFTINNGLFFALKGNKFDGSHFIEEALNKGAYAAITDNINIISSFKDRVFYVKNIIFSLQKLAIYHRNQFNIPVIAITGSNGKTTTKELLSKMLSKKYYTLFTKDNLNNHIGLPLTILKLRKNHKIAVIEIGANHLGEIKMLCSIAQPNYGYITNFGNAHLEGFGNYKGVIQAKSELYDYLRLNKKIAFVCSDDIIQYKQSKGIIRYFFSNKNNLGVHIKLLNDDPYKGINLSFKNELIHSNLIGIYNFINISAAIFIADYFKISIQKIKTVLKNYYSNNNRSQYLKKGFINIFLDAYNANPSSMELSINHFQRFIGTKTIILGDMLELGIYSEQEHKKIIKKLQNTDILNFFLIGDNFSKIKIKDKRIQYFTNRQVLEKFLKINTIKTNNILIKGSRKFSLEKLIPFF